MPSPPDASGTIPEILALVQRELQARADPEKARDMAAYLKTDMPFHGVQARGLKQVAAQLRDWPFDERDEWEATIRALWALPHREEKHVAILLTRQRREHRRHLASLPLYQDLITDGAWWDLVDPLAVHCVGDLWKNHRPDLDPVMDRWIDDDHLWLRRTALIAQNNHDEETDLDRLFRYSLARAHEKEFFIRKAIGWALREASDTFPDEVATFLHAHKEDLSGLSWREAARHLKRDGRLRRR